MPQVNTNAGTWRIAYKEAMTRLNIEPRFVPIAESMTWDFERFAFEEASHLLENLDRLPGRACVPTTGLHWRDRRHLATRFDGRSWRGVRLAPSRAMMIIHSLPMPARLSQPSPGTTTRSGVFPSSFSLASSAKAKTRRPPKTKFSSSQT